MVNYDFLSVYFYSVPNLRFREFSFPWHQTSIKDLLSFQNGINGAPEQYGKGIKYISVGDILNNDYITYDKIVGSIDISQETLKNYSVTYGDILFQRSSEIKDDIGRTNVYLDKDNTATFGGFVIRGKKIGDYNPSFFSFLLKSPSSRKSIVRLGAGAQHYNIGQENIKTLSFYFPNEIEQVKIANLLSKIDERIQTQSKIIELKQSLIKDIEDKLLWKSASTYSRHISDFLTELNDKSKIQNQYPLLSSTKKGLFLQTDYFNKEAASSNNIGYKIVHEGDIIISPQNLWMGNITYNDKFVNGLVSPSYRIYKVKEEYNAYYISRILMSYRALSLYKNISEQGASIVRRNLNVDAFNELCFPIPNIKKQDEVSLFLSKLHQELNSEIEILRQLKNQKKYLLCNMFI